MRKQELNKMKQNQLADGGNLDLAVSNPNHYLRILNDSNYHQWRRSVEVSLIAKNKLIFVTGGTKCPDPGSALEMQWKRCNSMVTAWLLHSVEKDIAETLLYFDTASEIWSDLRLRFGQPSLARTFQVQKELFNISQSNLSISSYYTKFKRFWDEYLVLVELPKCISCGVLNPVPKMILNQQVLQFLVGLNESYNAVRANALMMKPTPSMGEVYQMCLEEEKQRALRNNSGSVNADSSAFSVFPKQTQGSSNSNQSGGQNFNPKNGNNNKNTSNQNAGSNSGSSNSGNGGQKSKPYYYCEHCKVPGHSMSRCFKIHGYPKDFNQRKFAGNTTTSEDSKENSDRNHTLTKNQYERLLALLDNQQIGGSHTTENNKSCMTAGPFNEESTSAW